MSKYNTKQLTAQECIKLLLESEDYSFITEFWNEFANSIDAAHEKGEDLKKFRAVHQKVGTHIVDVIQKHNEEKAIQEKAIQEKKGIFPLSQWPQLKEEGLLKEGDLVQLDITGFATEVKNSGQILQIMIRNTWKDTFEFGDYQLSGIVFFEGENLYIERGTKSPLCFIAPSNLPRLHSGTDRRRKDNRYYRSVIRINNFAKNKKTEQDCSKGPAT